LQTLTPHGSLTIIPYQTLILTLYPFLSRAAPGRGRVPGRQLSVRLELGRAALHRGVQARAQARQRAADVLHQQPVQRARQRTDAALRRHLRARAMEPISNQYMLQ